MALASGNRVSELAALNRSAISFQGNQAGVTMPVRQRFLFKNQALNRVPPNVQFSALRTPKGPCPVAALKQYLECTMQYEHASGVFLHPFSSTSLNSGSILYWLCKAISSLVPGAIPRAHDVRKLSYSLAWARGVPIEKIVKRGFWSSGNVFINKYLLPAPADARCVAGGSG